MRTGFQASRPEYLSAGRSFNRRRINLSNCLRFDTRMYLKAILEYKKSFVAQTKASCSLKELQRRLDDVAPPRPFDRALQRAPSEAVRVIPELKKASPSKGLIRSDFRPVDYARSYEQHGAAALSVLTDEQFFQGSLAILTSAREAVSIPVLRKDFTIDEYQIVEARVAGADAVLLIAAILSKAQMEDYLEMTHRLGMNAVVEIHTFKDLERALGCESKIIGINNRNLDTFEVDLRHTERILQEMPQGHITISESGISSPEDVRYCAGLGVDAILIGEALMREPDPGEALRRLMSDALQRPS
jgi:indole-3-glycerol phosphate synthase